LKRAALAALVLGGIAVAPAQAAFIISEASVDGAWFNQAQAGRGALVDYIPGEGVNGTLFTALYTFDTTGQPVWLTLQGQVVEGQFALTNVPVVRTTGGAFATQSPPGTNALVGNANITFNTCEDLRITLTLTTAGLPNLPANQAVELQFSRGGLAGAQCVYRQAFTACPAGTTAVANQPRTCRLTGTLNQTVRLTNAATYLIDGAVNIGNRLLQNQAPTQTGTLVIEPGTLLRGAGGALDYLTINPGSRIFAEGTPSAPIIFTGPTETSGSWGGLVIGGLATNNNASQAGGTAAFEADPTLVWGGGNDQDSSGVLRYIQIRNAGTVISSNVELNSLTLGSVGSRTVLEYIQAHNGLDDGFEFFGGTVNGKYLVVTSGNDDGLDFDVGGYRGQVQYAYVQANNNADTADGSCVESDNNAQSFNATPRAVPRVANLTCVGQATGPQFRRQIRIRRGSGGEYYNVVVAQQPSGECVTLFDAPTFDQTTAGTLLFRGSSLLGCATNFAGGNNITTDQVTAWFNGCLLYT
ncbi:MAG: hypothetical protein N2439_01155, partial [Anaerolineae bacterium]|nr:hypothetical protein [Anaerolineae bacterium]